MHNSLFIAFRLGFRGHVLGNLVRVLTPLQRFQQVVGQPVGAVEPGFQLLPQPTEVAELPQRSAGLVGVGGLRPGRVAGLGDRVLVAVVPDFPEVAVNLEAVGVGDLQALSPAA